MIAPLDKGNWMISNLNEFNGKAEDMLNATSLHLSFTDWSSPLRSAGSMGIQDVEGVMMESIISIREGGKWIGDVDAVSALNSPKLFKMEPQRPCHHEVNAPPTTPMTSIECWDELRDCPAGLVVVRAYGNWVSRLSATVYLAQLSMQSTSGIHRILVCPRKVCWACVEPVSPSTVFIY
jgi:hypothetical protein